MFYFGRATKYLCINPKKRLDFFKLLIRPDFKEAVSKIREYYKIDFDDSKQNKDQIIKLFENVELFKESEKIAFEFKKSKQWAEIINNYVITGDTIPSIGNDPNGLFLEVDFGKDGQSDPEYYLKINTDTTISDIKKVWPEITKTIKKGIRTKDRTWKKFWRDYEIYKLASEGKTIKEIDHLIKEKFQEDLDYGNIIKIESNFRKKIGISNKLKKYKLKMSKK